MKMNYKILMTFLVFGLFMVNTNYAQTQTFPGFKFTSGTSQDGSLEGLEIDVKSPMNDQYEMNISI